MKNWMVVELTSDGSLFDYKQGLTEVEAKQLAKEMNASNWRYDSEYYACQVK